MHWNPRDSHLIHELYFLSWGGSYLCKYLHTYDHIVIKCAFERKKISVCLESLTWIDVLCLPFGKGHFNISLKTIFPLWTENKFTPPFFPHANIPLGSILSIFFATFAVILPFLTLTPKMTPADINSEGGRVFLYILVHPGVLVNSHSAQTTNMALLEDWRVHKCSYAEFARFTTSVSDICNILTGFSCRKEIYQSYMTDSPDLTKRYTEIGGK